MLTYIEDGSRNKPAVLGRLKAQTLNEAMSPIGIHLVGKVSYLLKLDVVGLFDNGPSTV